MREKGKISSMQLMFLIITYNIGTSFIFTVGGEAKEDAWLAALLGTAISLIMAMIYLSLANRFPGQTLVAINDQVWGGFFGKIFSVVFILYIFIICTLTINLTVRFQKELLLETPPLVLALLGTGITLILISRGLKVLARCIQLISIINWIIWVFILLLAIPSFDIVNFQPVFQTPIPLLFTSALRVSAFSFATGFGFLMIFPRVSDSQKIHISVIKAFAVSGLLLVSTVAFTIGILGSAQGYFLFPALNASRLINVGEIFTRMEVLTGIIFWLGGFLVQTIYINILTETMNEFFKLKSAQTLIIPLWIVLSLVSVQMFASSSEDVEFASKVYNWFTVPIQYVIPLLTMGVALVRKPGREDNK